MLWLICSLCIPVSYTHLAIKTVYTQPVQPDILAVSILEIFQQKTAVLLL